ncbi:MAG: GNAT family N-acetyltransferase [Gemmatimonadaceae bacterium]
MPIDVSRVPLDEIRPFRDLYRHELRCQIIHDSYHQRGFTDSYLIRLNGTAVGYGSVAGVRNEPRDLIIEFYVLPTHRGRALQMFHELAIVSQAKAIEGQTNDRLLTLMLYDCATNITSDRILFVDAVTTHLTLPGGTFGRTTKAERKRLFPHTREPEGDWRVELEGDVVATGGLMFHYNVPYGDIYMEVAEPHRRRGIGGWLVQELKRMCYEMGCIPAARCDADNIASRATLQRAGMFPCARVLRGDLGG